MKKLISILVVCLLAFGYTHGQIAFTTTQTGAVEWLDDHGNERVLTRGRIEKLGAARLLTETGRTAATLDSAGIWGAHTINGVVSTSVQDFDYKLELAGFSQVSSVTSSVVSVPYLYQVSLGMVPGHTIVDKFGFNGEIRSNSAPEEVWEFSEAYNYDANGTAPIQYLSTSSTVNDQPVEVYGLDIDGYAISQTVTADGQNNVSLSTPLWRVYRNINVSATRDIDGVLYVHTDPNPVNGVPSDASVRSIIVGANNQTLMALYTIPKDKLGVLWNGEFMIGLEGNSGALAENADCAYYSRRHGQRFTLKKLVRLMVGGSSVYQDVRVAPDAIPELTDIKMVIQNVTATVGASGTFIIELIDERPVFRRVPKQIWYVSL